MASAKSNDDKLRVELKALQDNIKSVHPANPESELHKTIKIDHARRLEYQFNLGEFERDLRSKNAQLLLQEGRNGGLQDILYLCVDLRAHRCIRFLIEWTKRDNPYWYDQKALFKYAKRAALGPEAKMSCLLALMEARLTEENLPNLCLFIFPQVRSVDFAERVHKMMIMKGSDHPTLPALIELCGLRYSHPAVLNSLVFTVFQREEDINDIHYGRMSDGVAARWERTALSEATHSLNVEAIEIMLANGADPRKGARGGPTTSGYNPLYRLLGQELDLPIPEFDGDAHDDCECRMIPRPNDELLYHEVNELGFRLINGIELMFTASKKIHGYVEGDEFINLYHKAADIYGETLRKYLISKIRRHLSPSAQSQLIELKPLPRWTSYVPKRLDQEVEYVEEYKFLDSLNGTKLEDILDKFNLLIEGPLTTVWTALMQVENMEWIRKVIKDTIEEPRLANTMDLLYEFILDPKSRPQEPNYNPDLSADEMNCVDDFSD